MFTSARGLKRIVLLSVFVVALLASPTVAQHSPGQHNTGNQQQQSDLLLFAVGIAKYQEPGNDLFWMDQDARDHDAFWKNQQGGLFHQIETKALVNKQATEANVRAGMKDVERRAKKGDRLVAPWHGHGAVDPNTGEWVFCTYDGYIRAGEIREWVKRLSEKGVLVILIYDSCHSGAMLKIDVPNVVVFASSEEKELSWDINGFLLKGNSLFTTALFEALDGKADANGDGVVTMAEVVAYLQKRMPELVGPLKHTQTPGVCYGGVSPETPLVKLRGPAQEEFVPPAPPVIRPPAR